MCNIFHRIPLVLPLVLLLNGLVTAQQTGWKGYQTPNTSQPTVAPLPVGQPQGNGQTDFLLLKTGFLMEGAATNDGKHYTVKTEDGRFQIPVGNVEFLGTSRQDVYLFRRNLIDGNNCQELMRFAEWCSNNGLVNEAVEEYARARRVAPNSILDASILRQIELLQQQMEGMKEQDPFTVSETGVSQFGSADSDGEDFNRLVNRIPKSIGDIFQKKVQPTLTSRCATADCHGSTSDNGFKIGIPRQPNGVTMYQNLQASLRWIDPVNPSASPLLTAMVSPHGGSNKPPFNVESRQYVEAIQWIQTTIKDLPTEYADRLYAAQQPPKVEMVVAPPSRPPEMPTTFFTETNQALPPREPVPPSVQAQSVTKVASTTDPLDPALFNARFHGR